MKLPFSTSKPSTPAPQGAHPARLVRIVDCGSALTPFTHEDGSPVIQRKVSIAWELYTDPRMEDGRPFMVSAKYTRSLNEKSGLYKLLNGWLGSEFGDSVATGSFDLKSILGRPCLVQINHGTSKKGSTFAQVGGVMVLPKALAKVMEEQVNPNLMFDLDAFDKAAYDALPPWQREDISKTPEYLAAIGNADEDIAF